MLIYILVQIFIKSYGGVEKENPYLRVFRGETWLTVYRSLYIQKLLRAPMGAPLRKNRYSGPSEIKN